MSGHTPDVPRRLVDEARAGNDTALRELVKLAYPRVRRWALVHLGDPDDADDLTQDVLVRMIRSLDSFRGRSAFATWLYTLTRNAATDRRRGRERRSRLAQAVEAAPDGHVGAREDPARRVERRELARLLEGFFGDLPPRQREAFELVDLEGFSTVEAAEMLGVAAASVRVHVFKARRRLRSLILDHRPELMDDLA